MEAKEELSNASLSNAGSDQELIEQPTPETSDSDDVGGSLALQCFTYALGHFSTETAEALGSSGRLIPLPSLLLNKKRSKNNKEAVKYYKLAEKSICKGTTKMLCRKTKSKNCSCCKDLFGLKDLEDAVELLTKCIAYAVPRSPTVSLALFLRAQTLYILSYCDECLVDLDRIDYEILKINSHIKALELRAACYEELADYNFMEAKRFLSSVPINDDSRSSIKKKLKKYPLDRHLHDKAREEHLVFNEIKNPNEKFPCASDAIQVKYSDHLGRHIVATRDINVGELLVVEEPYSTVMSVEKSYKYCWRCLRGIWTGIPCDHCVKVVYCSEKCKTTDWNEFHKIECTPLDLLLTDNASEYAQVLIINLRHVLRVLADAGGLANLKEKVDNLSNEKSRDTIIIEENGKSECHLFDISHLLESFGKIAREDMISKSLIAVEIVTILAACTDLFGVQYDKTQVCNSNAEFFVEISKNDDILRFGELLTLLLGYDRNKYLNVFEFNNIHLQSRGHGIYGFSVDFERTCSANTIKVFKGNQLNIFSSLPIKKGEQITINDDRPKCGNAACEIGHDNLNHKSYKKRSKSAEWKLKIDKVLTKFSEIEKQIFEREYNDKDELLKELGDVLKVVYEGVNLPCSTFDRILAALEGYLFKTGNLSKSFKHSGHLVKDYSESIFDH